MLKTERQEHHGVFRCPVHVGLSKGGDQGRRGLWSGGEGTQVPPCKVIDSLAAQIKALSITQRPYPPIYLPYLSINLTTAGAHHPSVERKRETLHLLGAVKAGCTCTNCWNYLSPSPHYDRNLPSHLTA